MQYCDLPLNKINQSLPLFNDKVSKSILDKISKSWMQFSSRAAKRDCDISSRRVQIRLNHPRCTPFIEGGGKKLKRASHDGWMQEIQGLTVKTVPDKNRRGQSFAPT